MMEKVPHAVGKAMHAVRTGMDHVLYQQECVAAVPESIEIRTSAFHHQQPLAAKYTLDGAKLSPPLTWRNVPAGAAGVVLLIEDADSPTPHPIVHALVGDLDPGDGELAEGGLGDRYTPPDPPPGHGPHRYVFQLYALAVAPAFPIEDLGDLKKALKENPPLAKGRLIGTYERP